MNKCPNEHKISGNSKTNSKQYTQSQAISSPPFPPSPPSHPPAAAEVAKSVFVAVRTDSYICSSSWVSWARYTASCESASSMAASTSRTNCGVQVAVSLALLSIYIWCHIYSYELKTGLQISLYWHCFLLAGRMSIKVVGLRKRSAQKQGIQLYMRAQEPESNVHNFYPRLSPSNLYLLVVLSQCGEVGWQEDE